MSKLKTILLVIGILSITFFFFHKCSNTTNTTITKKTYKKGKAVTEYHKGKDSVSFHTSKYKKDINLKKKDTTKSFIGADSTSDYNIRVKVTPSADSSRMDFHYFLKLHTKKLMRVDTLVTIRIDTLLETKTRIVRNPFYNTFWFGAALTSLVIIVISLLVK